ncbi:hypothetical protein ACNKHK_21690 [Shigella flexneri]
MGMMLLLAIAITHDIRHRGDEEMDAAGYRSLKTNLTDYKNLRILQSLAR